jgi:hypothetical protein
VSSFSLDSYSVVAVKLMLAQAALTDAELLVVVSVDSVEPGAAEQLALG